MTLQVFDCEQGSAEWFAARAGIPTASEFATVMAKGTDRKSPSVTRARYMRQLAGEIITGEPAPEGYSNGFMERGKALEAEARALYAMTYEPVQVVGFLRRDFSGASPDSLVGDDGGLEIKTAIPAVQIERLQRGGLPPEHRAQVQGNLLVSGRHWWDFMSYCPKLPALVVRVYRDHSYLADLDIQIDAFNRELREMVESIRAYNGSDLKAQLVASLESAA